MARVCSWCGLPDPEWLRSLEGIGSALKPAIEPIILARKPLDGTVANNVLAHGVGGLNIDATRVRPGDLIPGGGGLKGGAETRNEGWQRPSHVTGEATAAHTKGRYPANVLLDEHAAAEVDNQSADSSRFFPVFKYQAKAPKRERPVIEREDGTKVQHPTVKPLTLMEWLVALVTPPGGVVLDPFAGSGATLEAARNKGMQPIGVEQSADYCALIRERMD